MRHIFTFAIAILTGLGSFAQATAKISGTVRDEQG